MASEWTTVTVGELASSERNSLVGGPFGSNLVSRDYADGGVPVIRGQNMGERWIGGEFAYVTADKAASLSANIARPGDVIFTQRGTLGQVAVVPGNAAERYVISQSQMKVTVNDSLADPLFIYYVFRSSEQRAYVLQNAIQTGVPHINLGILRDIRVPLPPLNEQRAIVHILGTLDDKTELNRRMNETLEEMARAIFRSWFVDFDPVRAKAEGRAPSLPEDLADLFPSGFDNSPLGEIPAGWDVMPIGEAVRVLGGGTPSTKEPAFWEGGVHCWATPKDLSKLQNPILLDTKRKVTDAGLAKISSGLLPAGTVLLSSRAPVGYLAVAHTPVSVNQGFIAMVCEGPLTNHYVLHWALSNMEQIKARASGTTFPEISKKNFRPMLTAVPSGGILSAFETLVGSLYDLISFNLQHSRTIADLRDALLPQLISGGIQLETD